MVLVTHLFLAAFLGSAAKGPNLLPAFEIQDADAKSVASPELVQKENWLLIYVSSPSQATDVLRGLFKEEDNVPARKVKILVGGATSEELSALAEKHTALDVTWYADASGRAFSALKLSGTPFVLGLRGNQIAWSLAGILSRSSDMRSILKSWIRE